MDRQPAGRDGPRDGPERLPGWGADARERSGAGGAGELAPGAGEPPPGEEFPLAVPVDPRPVSFPLPDPAPGPASLGARAGEAAPSWPELHPAATRATTARAVARRRLLRMRPMAVKDRASPPRIRHPNEPGE
jgi:hypothetical protein